MKNVINSFTPKSVPAGTKNSLSKDFLLAKHKDTNIPTMMKPFSSPAVDEQDCQLRHYDLVVLPSAQKILLVIILSDLPNL